MSLNQRTIAAATTLKGVGLFWGRPVAVTLRPAEPDAGVVLVRTDLPGGPSARVSIESLGESPRHSTMRIPTGREVHLVEHLLAAIGGLQIDNLLVEINADELPCLDGSALPYVEALTKAGIVEQNRTARQVELSRPIEVGNDAAFVKALPSRDGLFIAYTLDYGERYLPRQTFELKVTEESFGREIAPARTYVLREEIEQFRARGLGLGATPENTIIVEEDGSTQTALRFEDECIRHKVLDLVGDLQVIGGRLVARIVARGSGHKQNAELAREIIREGTR